jgi:hypothetical protein
MIFNLAGFGLLAELAATDGVYFFNFCCYGPLGLR